MSKADDIELTKRCALAMGYTVSPGAPGVVGDDDRLHVYESCVNFAGVPALHHHWYWPLTDDGQALALVKRFGLSCGPAEGDDWAVWDNDDSKIAQAEGPDLNRAIVECVAGMP